MLSLFALVLFRLLKLAAPPPNAFPEVQTIANNITNIIKLFGFGLSGGAFGIAFILLMMSWGNERREATAKAAMWCACIGFLGLLATGLIQLLISRIVGVDLPK